MKFASALVEGRLLKRYKRFLADVMLDDGEVVTAHTSNTGAMMGCSEPGSRVWLSRSENPKRKYPFTWEIVEVLPGVLCGINTLLSNHLVAEAIATGTVPALSGYDEIRREVPYGRENSRIDLLLESGPSANLPPCYVEVKNVTLNHQGVALFPDAVTVRGSKHLRELISVVEDGARAVIFYCVQRGDCRQLSPADDIDAVYGQSLRRAIDKGVEVMAYQAEVRPEGIQLAEALPVCL